MQINASDDRSASSIETKILDVVQMNSIMSDSKPKCLVWLIQLRYLSNSSFYTLLSILSCLGNWWNWWSTWWWKRCSGGHLEDGNLHLSSYLVLCSALLYLLFSACMYFSPYQTSFCITWFVLLPQINAEKSNNSDRNTNGEETEVRKSSRKSNRTAKLLRPVSIKATLSATIFFVFEVY